MWKDGKYLFAYLLPLAALQGLYLSNYWTFSGVFFAFVFMPVVEIFATGDKENFEESAEPKRTNLFFFDLLLYLNLPLLYFIVFTYSERLPTYNFIEIIGATFSTGIVIGAIGINVAHELGHRPKVYEQTIAKMLLLPALYMHFFIEHNRGHHKNVATDKDPASARFGETIYAFWLRAVVGEYKSAWHLETERLAKKGISFWNIENDMIKFHIIEFLYLSLMYANYGTVGLISAIVIACVGFLLLESVNYIEHYGLRRKKLANGHYEKVMPWHSWNSNHELGRIVLYELTRHSDHHFKASRKYQILRHQDKSPQLPYGYPGSVLLSLLPPLWFKIMNKRVLEFQQ